MSPLVKCAMCNQTTHANSIKRIADFRICSTCASNTVHIVVAADWEKRKTTSITIGTLEVVLRANGYRTIVSEVISFSDMKTMAQADVPTVMVESRLIAKNCMPNVQALLPIVKGMCMHLQSIIEIDTKEYKKQQGCKPAIMVCDPEDCQFCQ